jgi:hypothetical protein
MPSTADAVPRRTRVSTLRARRERIAREVRRCEANVEGLRSEPGLPAERKMISAVRELADARARLAQISRELGRAQGR